MSLDNFFVDIACTSPSHAYLVFVSSTAVFSFWAQFSVVKVLAEPRVKPTWCRPPRHVRPVPTSKADLNAIG